jgi:hypothetical protein
MKLPVCRLHEKASLFAVKHRLGALLDQFREWSLSKINYIKKLPWTSISYFKKKKQSPPFLSLKVGAVFRRFRLLEKNI